MYLPKNIERKFQKKLYEIENKKNLSKLEKKRLMNILAN